jgi:hypothetical protein
VQKPSSVTEAAVEQAVADIARTTEALLDQLPDRRNPPPTLPPLRRVAGAR